MFANCLPNSKWVPCAALGRKRPSEKEQTTLSVLSDRHLATYVISYCTNRYLLIGITKYSLFHWINILCIAGIFKAESLEELIIKYKTHYILSDFLLAIHCHSSSFQGLKLQKCSSLALLTISFARPLGFFTTS